MRVAIYLHNTNYLFKHAKMIETDMHILIITFTCFSNWTAPMLEHHLKVFWVEQIVYSNFKHWRAFHSSSIFTRTAMLRVHKQTMVIEPDRGRINIHMHTHIYCQRKIISVSVNQIQCQDFYRYKTIVEVICPRCHAAWLNLGH